MKLDANDGDILWLELLGGAEGLDDRGWSIVVGPDQNPVVTGVTSTTT